MSGKLDIQASTMSGWNLLLTNYNAGTGNTPIGMFDPIELLDEEIVRQAERCDSFSPEHDIDAEDACKKLKEAVQEMRDIREKSVLDDVYSRHETYNIALRWAKDYANNWPEGGIDDKMIKSYDDHNANLKGGGYRRKKKHNKKRNKKRKSTKRKSTKRSSTRKRSKKRKYKKTKRRRH